MPSGPFPSQRLSEAGLDEIDCAVIGAGVVGLAVARALAQSGRDVIVLEAAEAIGTETSSRNSEVIHAGIYYPTGSNKARLCVHGKHMLYDFCQSHGIAHRRLGKLIVATNEAQHDELAALKARAAANGVPDLTWLDPAQAREMEPELFCTAALFSPSTGIVDSHGLMLALQGELEDAGGMIAFATPVEAGQVAEDGIVLKTGGDAPMQVRCRALVNSAGLHAVSLAGLLEGFPKDALPPFHMARGNYFSLNGKSPFTHLVYPMPKGGGLNIHITLDLAGRPRFGPDLEWVDSLDYTVNLARLDEFYDSIRQYWPALPDDSLSPAYAGIRPKLHGPGEPMPDFLIQGPEQHGVPNLINLFGIESPGLTSALAIGEELAPRLPRS